MPTMKLEPGFAAALEALHKLSSNHRIWINDARIATSCGCFYCCNTFQPVKIKEWTDKNQTALCPNCGIDAVLPGVTDPVLLRLMMVRWFSAAGKTDKPGAEHEA